MDLVRKRSAFIMQEKFSIILQKWNSQMCFLLFFNNFSKTFNLLDQNIQFISYNINIKEENVVFTYVIEENYAGIL